MLDVTDAQRGLSLLEAGRAADALPFLKQAVRHGDTTPKLLLGVAMATEQLHGTEQAESLYIALSELCPEWDEAWLRLADHARRSGKPEHAEQAYRATLQINPKRTEALAGLGEILNARNLGRDAQILLLQACGLAPNNAAIWNSLGFSFVLTKDFVFATTAFTQAQFHAPDNYDYALRRVEAAWRAGRLEPELALIEWECSQAPLDPVRVASRGFLLGLAGRLMESADALEAACLLAPNAEQPAIQLAITLMRLDRNADAIPLLRSLRANHPDNAKIANDLAVSLMRSHWHAEAAEILQQCLDQQPWSTQTACNLVITLLWQGRQADAVALARRAIAADPQATQPWRVLCNALPYAEGESGATLLAAARQCAATLKTNNNTTTNFSHDPHKRLRIGLLSNLMRTHPAGWLTVAGFESLDPAQFELVVFGRNAGDSIARRISTIASSWHEVDQLDDAALASFIRAENIDILIDLGGWGDHGRIQVCAHRPAPVQIKWVGMQNHSTGLDQVDLMISDRWETPADFAHLYSEKLLTLPDGYVCYSPPPYAPDVTPLPMLQNGGVTFGCFNNLAKITDGAIEVWSRILTRLPDARLVMKTHQFSEPSSRAFIHDKFAAHDISPSRILFEGRSPHREFLGCYNKIDIALDPFPYSGGLGTCEALWMGVPTITLPGESFASRHSLSHLSNVGLQDWIAESREHYVDLAIAKASDPQSLATLRTNLRDRVKSSPLCNAPRFGRNLAVALRGCWKDYSAEG